MICYLPCRNDSEVGEVAESVGTYHHNNRPWKEEGMAQGAHLEPVSGKMTLSHCIPWRQDDLIYPCKFRLEPDDLQERLGRGSLHRRSGHCCGPLRTHRTRTQIPRPLVLCLAPWLSQRRLWTRTPGTGRCWPRSMSYKRRQVCGNGWAHTASAGARPGWMYGQAPDHRGLLWDKAAGAGGDEAGGSWSAGSYAADMSQDGSDWWMYWILVE